MIFCSLKLTGLYLAIPYRTHMNHNNGYHFRRSQRSRNNQSRLDFSKMIIMSSFEGIDSEVGIVDRDEFTETMIEQERIAKGALRYLEGYVKFVLRQQQDPRISMPARYRFSTLKYFHKELSISK